MKSPVLLLLLSFPFTFLWAQEPGQMEASHLHGAIESGKVEVVRDMVQAGADVEYQFNGRSALHAACAIGNLEMVRIVLEAGAKVDNVSEEGEGFTALQGSVWGFGFEKNLKVVQQLLKAGADPNMAPNQYHYPLIYSIENADYPTFNVLLDEGADPAIRSHSGKTPLEYIIGKLTDPSTDLKSKEVYVKMKKRLTR